MKYIYIIIFVPIIIMGQTPCQEAVNNAIGIPGEFIPQCDEDGSYSETQCWSSTGYCWCVDDNGIEIPGTSIASWEGQPDCNNNEQGCIDADETILNILSIFINDPGFGFFGCSDIIPYLENQSIIPLNCKTNLSPFGYFNMSVSDVCECSCQNFSYIFNHNIHETYLMKTININGVENNNEGFKINLYKDGSTQKLFQIKLN